MEDVENAIFGPPDFKIFWGNMPPDPPTNLAPLSLIFKSPHLKIRSAVSVSGVQDSPSCVNLYRRSSIEFKIKIILILTLEFHKAAVPDHYCFLFMLANFLRLSNHIILIPIVMQSTRDSILHLDQEMIWRRPLL